MIIATLTTHLQVEKDALLARRRSRSASSPTCPSPILPHLPRVASSSLVPRFSILPDVLPDAQDALALPPGQRVLASGPASNSACLTGKGSTYEFWQLSRGEGNDSEGAPAWSGKTALLEGRLLRARRAQRGACDGLREGSAASAVDNVVADVQLPQPSEPLLPKSPRSNVREAIKSLPSTMPTNDENSLTV